MEGDASISKLKPTNSILELQNIHSRTLDCMLWGKWIRKWIARERSKLLLRHASARLTWAIERKERYPDLINMRGSFDTVKQALLDALEAIWKEILESLLERLYTSMPSHVAAVIKAEGWYTDY